MKKLFKFGSIISFLILLPSFTYAVTVTPSSSTCSTSLVGISKIICQIHQILNSIVPLLVSLGVVYFVWGVVNFITADSDEDRTKGKDKMISGIIGFAVIIGLWGLVNIVVNTFELATPAPVDTSSAVCTSIDTTSKFQDLITYIICLINSSIIPLIFTVAMVMFIWGVVNFFIINADEEAKREQGRQFMIWGIIALAVMLSVWGLVGIVGSTFGIKGGNVLPQVTPPK